MVLTARQHRTLWRLSSTEGSWLRRLISGVSCQRPGRWPPGGPRRRGGPAARRIIFRNLKNVNFVHLPYKVCLTLLLTNPSGVSWTLELCDGISYIGLGGRGAGRGIRRRRGWRGRPYIFAGGPRISCYATGRTRITWPGIAAGRSVTLACYTPPVTGYALQSCVPWLAGIGSGTFDAITR